MEKESYQKIDSDDGVNNSRRVKTLSWVVIIISLIIIALLAGIVGGYLGNSVVGDFLNSNVGKGEVPGVTSSIQETKEESATIAAVEKAQPAVVSIVVTKDLSKIYDDYYSNGLFPFSFGIPSEEGGQQEIGGGTGFFISPDGMLLTNKHVVQDEDAEYSVIMQDGTRYDNVKVLARDPIEDMAILKVDDGNNFPTIELGDSDSLKVGQTVIAIGNSLGEYQNSVTKGIVSGLERNITAGGQLGQATERLQNIIQTDAAINSGNSGGPLINLSGQVVGINTAVDFSGQLVGFALPINGLKDEIQSVKEGGEIIKPYLGVRYILLNNQIAEANDLPYDYGALVIRGQEITALAVVPGSPADKAGLEENDIVLEINEDKITEDNDLTASIQEYSVGETITLRVFHDDKEKNIEVKLEERPSI